MSFTVEQIKMLKEALDPSNVSTREQSGRSLSYVEYWHVTAEANRIFGFDGWSCETVYCKEVCRATYESYGKSKLKVGYESKVRVTIGNVTREGTGHGQAVVSNETAGQMLFDAIEGAAKEAESDAFKRAMRTFGNQFGLSLYNKGALNTTPPTEEEMATEKKERAEKFVQTAVAKLKTMDDSARKDWAVEQYKHVQRLENYPDLHKRLMDVVG